jgi:heme/copper-type cytochrome/quinol oxidase subunit 4
MALVASGDRDSNATGVAENGASGMRHLRTVAGSFLTPVALDQVVRTALSARRAASSILSFAGANPPLRNNRTARSLYFEKKHVVQPAKAVIGMVISIVLTCASYFAIVSFFGLDPGIAGGYV